MGTREVICIDVYIAKATERTQIINATRMVIMFMSKEYTIQTVKRNAQHLLAKVGTTIDKYTCLCRFYKSRHAQAVVTLVA